RYITQKAQYPFGYGLTYGKVEVTKAKLDTETASSGTVSVTAELTNSGSFDTQEVVQVYVKNLDSPLAVPNPQLAAFARVSVKAGETIEVTLPVTAGAFTVVDEDGTRCEAGGTFEVFVGCSQPDERSAELTGTRPVKLVYKR
ncbi:MAG: fibronectin type III-like domain-contianing protein, partial [Lachnospiraceae bacterium]|nr:fibronectin type III-like domain-contianing protein [Lachnospiraceae bacterium]